MCNMCKWWYPEDDDDQDQDTESSIIPLVVLIIIMISLIYGCVKMIQCQLNISDRMAKRELCMTEHLVEKDYPYHKANQICSTQNGFNPENFNQYYGKNHDN